MLLSPLDFVVKTCLAANGTSQLGYSTERRAAIRGHLATTRESLKDKAYARYHLKRVAYAYEVDHLVSLELGGSNALTNLWPEYYYDPWGARTKDRLEGKLHDLVCAGRLSLVARAASGSRQLDQGVQAVRREAVRECLGSARVGARSTCRSRLKGMRSKITLGIILAAFLVVAPAALAKNPPSFALWAATWRSQDNAAQDKMQATCEQVYGKTDDAKLGACFIKLEIVSLRSRMPLWEHAVARISKGQSAPCRKAIHAYWLASRKAQRASMIYLRTHPKRAATDIASDLNEEPYVTLRQVTDETKSRAVRVCG
jgi:hypothetical protein